MTEQRPERDRSDRAWQRRRDGQETEKRRLSGDRLEEWDDGQRNGQTKRVGRRNRTTVKQTDCQKKAKKQTDRRSGQRIGRMGRSNDGGWTTNDRTTTTRRATTAAAGGRMNLQRPGKMHRAAEMATGAATGAAEQRSEWPTNRRLKCIDAAT